ncbi:MAG: hypothetical protein KGZ65_00310 [Sphingomonadales bacterium]|nr:hypothetical protein [Sphingomonadaceae bacterium]MBS3929648.1 hypothetical protein [Sphingomonadales bacterium]
MASDRNRLIVLTGLALGLTGCASTGQTALAGKDNFGEAYRQTLAAQVINPNPEYDTPFAATDGDVIAQAIERYRTGKTKLPDRQIIGNLGRQGGSGAASAGSDGN